jgi:hypothetical protein
MATDVVTAERSLAELREELGRATVLEMIFSEARLQRAFRRIAKRDKDDLVAHPLKALVLIEYEAALCKALSAAIPSGRWSPGRAYICLTLKRSGAYRELVFPSLIDSIVGRCVIDALEPVITADDDGRTFSGRSHFSNIREPGDYESWFALWRDFTAAIDSAAATAGFAYVYDADINDFFPSIDRSRAKALLAQRTGAHASLLELLFGCLEAWLPRFRYTMMTGLPVENNDVSRLVAHNYIKQVDQVLRAEEGSVYLRYVDDTVVFTLDRDSALRMCELHHLELRQLGLSPSSAKTQILPIADFQAARHRDMNMAIEKAKKTRSKLALSKLVKDWYSPERRRIRGWDKVATILYSVSKQLGATSLRKHALDDIETSPSLAGSAIRYLASLELEDPEVGRLLDLAGRRDLDIAVAIRSVQACADGRVSDASSTAIAERAAVEIKSPDERFGSGYLKAQWLLALFKYGTRRQREDICRWGRRQSLEDEPWRLHYLYVAIACEQLKLSEAGTWSLLATSDVQLTLRLVAGATRGRLNQHQRVLRRCVESVNGAPGIPARILPMVRILTRAPRTRTAMAHWLREVLARKDAKAIRDRTVRTLLGRWRDELVA